MMMMTMMTEKRRRTKLLVRKEAQEQGEPQGCHRTEEDGIS
jgi:hypothetical protein